ncbi:MULTISPECIES: hypothetical protein [Streptomyces]|uniref:hypothetical protein n=1 Tax=Streptomyces TaxID=1883 RepID=UPI0007CD9A36|nr:hypothetical protein A4V12_18275 [Streptomyces noursei]
MQHVGVVGAAAAGEDVADAAGQAEIAEGGASGAAGASRASAAPALIAAGPGPRGHTTAGDRCTSATAELEVGVAGGTTRHAVHVNSLLLQNILSEE